MCENADSFFFGYYVVCLIDILGQKQELKSWSILPDDGDPNPEFIKAIRDTVGAVLHFRDGFTEHFYQLGKDRVAHDGSALTEEDQKLIRRFKDCTVQIERFSDTFVFSSQVVNTHGDASIMPMYRILATCCFAMIMSLAVNRPVRGAVTVGTGVALEDGSFYGPALAKAHYLENKVAGYPRVVLSRDALRFMAGKHAFSTDRAVNQTMSKMTKVCQSLTTKDTDGHWIVDFLGKGYRDIGDTPAIMKNAVTKAYDFVQTEADRFRKAGDSKLAERYDLLQQYIESRLPLWK